MDVGGGLGVDYDGSQTNFESSMNYTLQEYANDVVYHIQTVCDEAGVEHPTIISESGRAVSAYHSMLIFNVLGTTGFGEEKIPTVGQGRVRAAAGRPDRDLSLGHQAQRARGLSRRAAGARHGDEPVQRRLPAARAARARRKPVLGDLREDLQAHAEHGRSAGGSAVARGAAVGHLLLQFLAVPVDSRQLGDQTAVPGDADSPAHRAARPITP